MSTGGNVDTCKEHTRLARYTAEGKISYNANWPATVMINIQKIIMGPWVLCFGSFAPDNRQNLTIAPKGVGSQQLKSSPWGSLLITTVLPRKKNVTVRVDNMAPVVLLAEGSLLTPKLQ